ncbi:carbohydrate ABC transporter permease [Paenibacillus cymbidii]|uniref:carbohydrate ABC transporter permease n=1 Tax=Paenibacillus cymbidii TaxID=1639034 RepID=UPI001081D6AD|nr:carbohydrate ABC transporter permease [Paenibacillus cymbidii]
MKDSAQDRTVTVVIYAFLLLAALVVAYPLLFVLSASVSEPQMVNSGQVVLLPAGFNLEGYREILDYAPIWRGYANTIVYTVVGTLINLAVTLSAAYALSRRETEGRNVIAFLFALTMFFSGGLIPTYLLVTELGLRNSMWALILPGAASMYNIIICRTYFASSIPYELYESAKTDGASDFRMFVGIALPLSAPIVAVMALFYGVGHWNQFFSALIYLNDDAKYPLQLVLRTLLLQQQSSGSLNDSVEALTDFTRRSRLADMMKYGLVIVAAAPLLIVYPFLQRFFVKGMLVGAIKS